MGIEHLFACSLGFSSLQPSKSKINHHILTSPFLYPYLCLTFFAFPSLPSPLSFLSLLFFFFFFPCSPSPPPPSPSPFLFSLPLPVTAALAGGRAVLTLTTVLFPIPPSPSAVMVSRIWRSASAQGCWFELGSLDGLGLGIEYLWLSAGGGWVLVLVSLESIM